MSGTNRNNELPYEFLVEFQDKLRLAEEKFRNIDDVAVKVNGLLKELVLFYEADFALVMEVDWDLGLGFASYAYCAVDIPPIPHTIKSLPLDKLGNWVIKLRNNQPAIIDIKKLLGKSPELNIEALWHSLDYLLITPFSKHLNAGLIVVGNPRMYRQNLSFLSVLASMIVSDLNELKLQERVDIAIKKVFQHTEADVYVNCFGGLEIRGRKGILTDEDITGDQCYRLFAYLIFNRNKTKPVRELADIIWNDEPIGEPYKDVKNVVYRLKRILNVIELDDLVIGMSGTFIINPKYRVHVDFERFEDVFNKFLKEQDLRGKEKFFKTARHIYRGTLLPKCDHIHWFIPRIGYYQSMYLQLLKEYLSQKLQEGDYRVAQRIAVEGLADEPYDTDLIMYQIICLYQLGNRSLARNYYNRFETELTGEQRELIEKYKK